MGIIVPVFIDLPDNARVLPSISMARFFHQAGMWFNGVTKILLFRSPRSKGAMKAALCWITFDVIGYNDRNPCLHPAYDRFTMLRFFGELTSLNAER